MFFGSAVRNTSALLQQELDAPLVLLLLLREPPVRVQLRAVQGVFQPLHQPLLLVQLHLQLGQGQLQLALLLAQRHHLRSQPHVTVTYGTLSNAAESANLTQGTKTAARRYATSTTLFGLFGPSTEQVLKW